MRRLGDIVVSHARAICTAWLLLAVAAAVLASGLNDRLANRGFSVPGSQSALVTQIERDHIFGADRSRVFAVLEEQHSEAAGLRASVDRVSDTLAHDPHVAHIAPPVINRESSLAVVPFDIAADLAQAQKDLPAIVGAAKVSAGTANLTVVGGAAIFERYSAVARDDLAQTEKIAFPVTSIIILVAFLAVIATVIPMTLAGLGLLTTFGVPFLISLVTDLSVFSSNTALVLGLGLSIDYALFNVTRFREVLQRNGGDIPGAVRGTVATTGRAIAFSGLTIATAVGPLVVLQVGVFSGMAFGAMAAAVVAVAGGVTLVPSVLVLFGQHLDRLPLRWAAAGASHARWARSVAGLVLRRPLVILLLTVPLLVLAALPLLSIRIAFPTATALPSNDPVRTVADRVGKEFGAGVVAPLTLVSKGDPGRLLTALRADAGLQQPFEVRRGTDGWIEVSAPLATSPDSSASQETIRRLRRAMIRTCGCDAMSRV